MKIAAAYIRVSTDDQAEFSPDSQIKAIRKYAKEHDMILPEDFIYSDEGVSGRKAEKRPAFQQMIGTAKLKPRPFDVILLWKFSRFARNREDSIVYKSMLRKQCGIDVISVSEQLSEDKTSILIEALIEAMDEYYSLNLAEEVRRGMTEKFSRGGVVSQPPFGYKMGKGMFIPDEEKVSILQMIFNDFLKGMGTRAIASKLNEMGIRSTKGNPFENRTVEYILSNPVYIGKLRRSKNGRDNRDRFHQSEENTLIVDGKHKPLIDESVFENVQKKLTSNKKIYSKYSRQENIEFMLKGLVRCDNCGSTLTLSAAGKGLQCHQYAKGACRTSHYIALNKINDILIKKLRTDCESDFFNVVIKSNQQQNSAEQKNISFSISREEKKLQRIREAYEAGIDTIDEYKANKERIMKSINELKSKVELKSREEPAELLHAKVIQGLEILENPNTSEHLKNTTLRSFVSKIIFIKPQGIIEIHYKV